MADKLISGLPEATSIAGNDLLVTEQTSIAKKITADNLLHSLDELWTEHGGIESFDLYSQSGLSKTYRMTYADESYTDITITDGTGITDIVTTTSGLTHTITISLNDGTTKVFTVDDGVGISSISSPSTVGLEDTYTINYSDGSTSTFTVTNGASVSSITLNGTTITFAKDDGNTIDLPVPTLRIRYSVTQPDDDNDIITTPSNYMGVAWALDSAVLHYTDYSWFKIKGETGDNAEVSTYQRQYKYTDDGTQYPTSGYYSTIAAAQSAVGGAIQGKYLWIATTITWNNGTPSVIYTSSYQGLDGTGLSGVVKSLYMSDTSTSLAPDANGQVTVTSADVGAIKAPATASDGQVLTWDATDQVWYAGSVSTGTVNSVNSQLPNAGGNVTIYGTNVAMASDDATTIKAAIEANQTAINAKPSYSDLSGYLPLTGGTLTGNITVTDTTAGAFTRVQNDYRTLNFTVASTGYGGIYDDTNSAWVIRTSPTQNVTIPHHVYVSDTTDWAGIAVSNDYRNMSLQISTAGNAGLYDGANSAWIIRSGSDLNVYVPHNLYVTSPSTNSNTNLAATTEWVRGLVQYKANDTIDLANMVFAGLLTSSAKSINFFIPLPKDLSNITSASLSVDTSWEVRHPSGGYMIQTNSLASFGSVHCNVLSTGVRIYVDASASTSFTNNVPLAVRAVTATLKLT